MTYFTDIEQIFQKFIGNEKQLQIASSVLRKKNKVGGSTISDIKLYITRYGNENSLVLA